MGIMGIMGILNLSNSESDSPPLLIPQRRRIDLPC